MVPSQFLPQTFLPRARHRDIRLVARSIIHRDRKAFLRDVQREILPHHRQPAQANARFLAIIPTGAHHTRRTARHRRRAPPTGHRPVRSRRRRASSAATTRAHRHRRRRRRRRRDRRVMHRTSRGRIYRFTSVTDAHWRRPRPTNGSRGPPHRAHHESVKKSKKASWQPGGRHNSVGRSHIYIITKSANIGNIWGTKPRGCVSRP
mmetsp:Transcript_8229/g.30523  ORF Transcript_8229/g.30523 Transcript_8229/m.30523 type:complete len:205 (+) Transcript_8229:1476-2090(+)